MQTLSMFARTPYRLAVRVKINAAALASRLPAMRLLGFFTEEGGLISYGGRPLPLLGRLNYFPLVAASWDLSLVWGSA